MAIFMVIGSVTGLIYNKQPVLRVVICPTGGGTRSIYFELYKNKKMTCIYGRTDEKLIVTNNLSHPNLFWDRLGDAKTERSKIISNNVYNEIIDLANEIAKHSEMPNEYSALDSWDMIVQYKGKSYKIDYYICEEASELSLFYKMHELGDLLISESPIDIQDDDLKLWHYDYDLE